MRPRIFEWDRIPSGILRYGRPCKQHNHHDKTGNGVRCIDDNKCVACRFSLPPGLFEVPTQDIKPLPTRPRKYATKEEARRAHVERQKLWNKNNPEKFAAAQKNYLEKNKQLRSERNLSKYQNMDPVKKAQYLEKQRLRYQNMDPVKKAQSLEKQRERYHAKKLDKEQDEHSGS